MKPSILTSALLLAIRCYQRYLSPHKGFSCAYRVHRGCASCSTFGYRAIRRYGSAVGLIVLRQRLSKCGDVYRLHHPPRPRNYQAGECDPGCDFDCGGSKTCETAGDCMDCKDCLDWGRERKRQEEPAPEPQPLPPYREPERDRERRP